MEAFAVLVAFLVSLLISLGSEPYFSKKLIARGFTAKDYYKKDKPELPTKGGIVIIFATLPALIIAPMLLRLLNLAFDFTLPRAFTPLDQAILFTVLFYGFYGIMDDYVNVGRPSKLVMPLLFAYPLVMAFTSPLTLGTPFGPLVMGTEIQVAGQTLVTYSRLFRYIAIPLYIMVVANLVNMHSGFNGLQSGLSSIVLAFLVIKSYMVGNLGNILTTAAFLGAILGLWWYNKYPARIFEGNIGAMATGAAIGATIIVQGFLFAGFVMLIPHIVNFLMYAYWRVRERRCVKRGEHPGCYARDIKFGKVREDGTIEVPNRLTLKWVLPYYFHVTERGATVAMYGLTMLFCCLGLLVPY